MAVSLWHRGEAIASMPLTWGLRFAISRSQPAGAAARRSKVPPAPATADHTGIDMDIGQITRQLLGIARS